ncbi:MAG: homocysteine S-methyltransferase family protein [Lachnospiraceae bacterium]|jgi:5-methyltetrahydrofolate--homocysteine methyltransferase
MTKQEYKELVARRTVLLDGATGSNLMKMGMPKGICTEAWIAENPEPLMELQRQYVQAGSDIVYAPTFAANRICLNEHGLGEQTEELNRKLVDISKKATAGNCYVLGDMTTTGKPDLPYDVLFSAYQEQAKVLYESGVDLIGAETMIGAEETMAAIDAVFSVCDLPMTCTMTIESDGSLFFGGNVFDAAVSFQEMGVSAVGINCSTGPDQLVAVVSHLRDIVDIPIIVKPNLGLPFIDEQGNAIYQMTAESFAQSMKRLIDCGADVVGGCCGTTPECIRMVKEYIGE